MMLRVPAVGADGRARQPIWRASLRLGPPDRAQRQPRQQNGALDRRSAAQRVAAGSADNHGGLIGMAGLRQVGIVFDSLLLVAR